MEIRLKNIIKRYNELIAVNKLSLDIKQGELIALLGPSGCGKTTLLRIIAGLISLDEGEIWFNGSEISAWTPQQRNTAMVFQNYALFPHLTVAQNIMYGLKARKLPKQHINNKLQQILKQVALEGYDHRYIQELSGGQRQRVALARALIVEPDVLLFDEPLSNLDKKLRIEMRQEIRKIQKKEGITSIYVTHDQEEALAIADRIVVMKEGEIQQVATPEEIYYRPFNDFVASFVGEANLFNLDIIQSDNDCFAANLLGKKIKIQKDLMVLNNRVTALLRPEELSIYEKGIIGLVKWKENLGAITRYRIEVMNNEVVIDVINSKRHQSYNIGDNVYVDFDEHTVHLIYS